MIYCKNVIDVAFLFKILLRYQVLIFYLFIIIKLDFYYDWGSMNVIPKS